MMQVGVTFECTIILFTVLILIGLNSSGKTCEPTVKEIILYILHSFTPSFQVHGSLLRFLKICKITVQLFAARVVGDLPPQEEPQPNSVAEIHYKTRASRNLCSEGPLLPRLTPLLVATCNGGAGCGPECFGERALRGSSLTVSFYEVNEINEKKNGTDANVLQL